MKKFSNFLNESNSDNENLIGFEKKLKEIIGDVDKVNQILDLIPEKVILPLYYKGDVVKLRDGGEITITDVGFKGGEYIYYFKDEEGEEWYEREENIIF